MRRTPQKAPGTPSARLTELDDDGQPLHDASSDFEGEEDGGDAAALTAAPLWRGLDQARVQGALALALFCHALAFMPGSAARLGIFGAH